MSESLASLVREGGNKNGIVIHRGKDKGMGEEFKGGGGGLLP